jgi:phosphatidylinositol alpha-mannosyltransferase
MPPAVKVALVSPYDFSQPGGVNGHVANLAGVLRRFGIDAVVLASVPPGRPVPSGVIRLVGRSVVIGSAGARAHVNLDPRVVWHLRALLRRHRFDVVHLHNPLSPLVSAGVLASRRVAPGTAFVATFHEYRERLNPVLEVGKRLLRSWVDRLDGRIAVSEAALDFNRSRFPGKYVVIPNGVDVARFAAGDRGAPARDAARPTVLFVGRLEPRKGCEHLLAAFARVAGRFPSARLVVAGPCDDAMARRLRRYIGERGLRGVELVGRVSDRDLPALYRAADVFCAPSIGFESFGVVLLEAMAAGVAIVASDIRAYRAVVRHGREGLLVTPGQPAAIADAIEALLADGERRLALGAAGREAVASYDWSRVAERIAGFYGEVLATRAPRAAPVGAWR